jgi:hypothetical protein
MGRFGGMTAPPIRISAGSSMLVRCVIAGRMLLASGLALVLAYETPAICEL